MNSRSPLLIGTVLGSALTMGVLVLINAPWHQRAYANTAAPTAAAPSPVMRKPDTVDGMKYASGRIPQEIRNGKYPRSYFPGTEKLGADEMRVTAVGTGMPTQTPSNKSACFLVELGNGDSGRGTSPRGQGRFRTRAARSWPTSSTSRRPR